MKKRIREGNDFDVAWAIERGGVPEDFTTAINTRLTMVVYGTIIEHSLFTITGNILAINVPKEVAILRGDYRLVFEYTLPDAGQPDGDLKCKTDVVAFRIVPFTADSDDLTTIDVASDVAIGFRGDKGLDGDDAYQIWLDLGNVGTYEDYIAWQRQPAVEAGTSIAALELIIEGNESSRVTAEGERDAAETLRLSAESGRSTAEGLRDGAEVLRIEAEGVRDDNEGDRILAESDRADAEELRDGAELLRETAEEERIAAEILREANIQDAIDAAALANTKAGLADTAAAAANTATGFADIATLAANTAATNAQNVADTVDGRVTTVEDDIVQLAGNVSNIFTPAKNLFNKNTMIVDGYIISSTTGMLIPAADWGCTTYIKVKPSTYYAITSPSYSNPPVAFYDENLTLLSHDAYVAPTTTPANCSFVRFNLYKNTTKSTFDPVNVQIEEGDAPTTVEPYELEVKGTFEEIPISSFSKSDAVLIETAIDETKINIELGNYLSYEDSINYTSAAKLVKRAWIENPVTGKNYFIYNIAADSTNPSYGYAIRIASYTTDINTPTPVGVFTNIQDHQDIYEEIIRILSDGAILHIWINWSMIDGDPLVTDYSIKWVFSNLAYQEPIDYTKSQLGVLLVDIPDLIDQSKTYELVFETLEHVNTNLLNPSTITPNVVLVAGGGTTGVGAGPSYDTSDYMPVTQLTDYKGLTSANAALPFRFINYYNAAKVYLSQSQSVSSFTTPANCAYIRVSWANNSNTVNAADRGVFLSTVASFEAFQFPYIELKQPSDVTIKTDKELVSKGNVATMINTALSQESGELNLQIYTTPNADVVIDDGEVAVTMGVKESDTYQGLINFASVDVFGLVYVNGDDIAPTHIQNSTVGANHGWAGNTLTCNAHGLTSANIGQEWTANDGVKFTIMRIDGVNTFTVLRKNSNASMYLHSNDGWTTQTSLTDGVTTLTITASTSIQYYPSVYKKSTKIFANGKEIIDTGTYLTEVVDLVEEYDILNKESLRLNAVDPSLALSSINVKNTYQFRKGGINYVFCRYKMGHELVFSNIMAAQAVMLSTTGYLYAPKILPFGDAVDLRRLTLFSALGGTSRLFTEGLWETGKVPNRVTNYTSDKSKALMLGILTDRGVGKDLANFTKDTFEIRGDSGKTYPHPVSSTAVGSPLTAGESYDIAMFRAYFEPDGVVDKVELPFDNKTIILIDIHQAGTFTVKLSDRLNGMAMVITDSQNVTLGSDMIVNSEIEITTTSDYAYVEFEVK